MSSTLIELASDLTAGDSALVEKVRAAVASPPMTLEEVGFYGAHKNPPGMNCFLFMVTELGRAGHLLSAEDKHVVELLEDFGKEIYLPQRIRSWFPKRLKWDGDYEALGLSKNSHGRAEDRFSATYDQAMQELETAFEAKGTSLRMLQFYVGDTIPFITVTSEVAKRWDEVPVAEDRSGTPLFLCRPDWDRFFNHITYAAGWDLERPRT